MNQQRSLDWNYNRRTTRDLLLECDQMIMPPHPHSDGADIIYPWPNHFSSNFEEQMYTFAKNSGYNGTQDEFENNFGTYLENNRTEIIFDTFNNFPENGQKNKLYFDLTENILYYWADTQYLPVNAMLIPETVLEGGEA